MAIAGSRVTIGTAATALFTADSDSSFVTVTNTGAAAVDLGGSAVVSAAGYNLAVNETLRNFPLAAGEVLYAIAAVSGTVQVLRSGIG